MGRTYDEIDERWATWIAEQPMFFVATAPLGADGHVNVSPKGPAGALRVLGPRRVCYLDVGGSGAETIAHLRENGRIVVMLCAFDGPPRILRLHGTGEAVFEDDERFEELVEGLPSIGPPQSTRSVIVVDVERIADSCGYGVPLMSVDGRREHYELSAAKRMRVGGPTALAERRAEVNARSIDGLPALEPS
ncbi:MAG TPA: pyridoxamine 5'-phosphate oxidase family protein [Solirubrobacteraceae bacterium]|nr:pyridoxamine 5'-phosphate oxidase family protein [Solirubrobacteraceae bacterium]